MLALGLFSVVAFWPGSQSDQDRILESLLGREFGILQPANRFCVEFGFAPGQPGSNSWQLRKNMRTAVEAKYVAKHLGVSPNATNKKPYSKAWKCMLVDGQNIAKTMPSIGNSSFMVRAIITSTSIASLFTSNSVPLDLDYLSVDIDTADIWVLKALLTSGYRPRVVSVEYNSNFPETSAIAFPDPATMEMVKPRETRAFGWNHTCYTGSTARALEEMMGDFEYALTNVSRGFDLFFVRGDLWRPRPALTTVPGRPGYVTTQYCMASHGHRPMTPAEAVNLLSWDAYRAGAKLCDARRNASAQLREIAALTSRRDAISADGCRSCFKKLTALESVTCNIV